VVSGCRLRHGGRRVAETPLTLSRRIYRCMHTAVCRFVTVALLSAVYTTFFGAQRPSEMSKPAENHLKTGGESLDFQNKLEVTNRISDSCYDTFQALKLRRKHKYIIYKIGDEEIDVEKTGERKSVSLVSVCCKNVL
jgi:hypothetical protein